MLLSELDGADIEGIEADLADYRIVDATWTLDALPVSEFPSTLGAFSPEEYLFDGDEDGYEKAVLYGDMYEMDGADALPPLTVAYTSYGGVWVFDGLHRLCGARTARLESVPVYMLDQTLPN